MQLTCRRNFCIPSNPNVLSVGLEGGPWVLLSRDRWGEAGRSTWREKCNVSAIRGCPAPAPARQFACRSLLSCRSWVFNFKLKMNESSFSLKTDKSISEEGISWFNLKSNPGRRYTGWRPRSVLPRPFSYHSITGEVGDKGAKQGSFVSRQRRRTEGWRWTSGCKKTLERTRHPPYKITMKLAKKGRKHRTIIPIGLRKR